MRLVFAYDHMGRRVRKMVYTYGGGWPAVPQVDERYVYPPSAGWAVVVVLDGRDLNQDQHPDNTVVRAYTWGRDVSGAIDGAGGIGGLLACVERAGAYEGSYWFVYDGNGNVGQVLDGSDRSVAAHYEYDPYGNAITASGDYASANPFRFSTKGLDVETGLYYYGYRYYSPRLGRWASRDPMEELGGVNLHLFVSNAPIVRADPLGLNILEDLTKWVISAAMQRWAQILAIATGEIEEHWYGAALCRRGEALVQVRPVIVRYYYELHLSLPLAAGPGGSFGLFNATVFDKMIVKRTMACIKCCRKDMLWSIETRSPMTEIRSPVDRWVFWGRYFGGIDKIRTEEKIEWEWFCGPQIGPRREK